MPTRTFNREWCKFCKEWELFDKRILKKDDGKLFDGPLTCRNCKNEYEETLLKDIPKEKIIEQRERYKKYEENNLNSVFMMMARGGLSNVGGMNESWPDDTDIIENDAGQYMIDKKNKEIRDEKINKLLNKRQKDLELKAKYHKLGRNDLCICNSGKKYKRCCWNKIYKI